MHALTYDPETGVFRRRVSTMGARVGEIAGSLDMRGYRRISVRNTNWKASRLAWLYVHGKMPETEIFVKNGIVDDLRATNLDQRPPLLPEVTAESLRGLLDYNPDTGVFTWKYRAYRHAAGSVAGYKASGYIVISIGSRPYRAHRLAWLYVYGRWPEAQVDHVNLDRSDNRIANLREASQTQNSANVPLTKRNKSGFKGVSWDGKKQKWVAVINVNGKQRWLGGFDSKEDAVEIRRRAAEELHGSFVRFE